MGKNSNSLPDTFMNKSFIEIEATDSTNNYAMQLIQKSVAQHGMAVFAHEQTSGKGQRGKQWHSNAGENIIVSVILNTKGLLLTRQLILNMSAALAVYDFFSLYAGNETSVKWPNDLYWRDRKAGGTLIENVITGNEWQWAITGIGININQTIFDERASKAVSLKQITGKTYNAVTLARELADLLKNRYDNIFTFSAESILQEYNNVLFKKGESVTLKKNNIVFDCFIKGVNIYGQLVIEKGIEQLLDSGEVEWVI